MTRKRSASQYSRGSQKGDEIRRLTIVERSVPLDLGTQGHVSEVVRDPPLEKRDIAVPCETVSGYRKTHVAVIAQRRELRREKLRDEPLAHPLNRIGELGKMYKLTVLALFLEPCTACLGRGYVHQRRRRTNCAVCRGQRLVLPPDVQAYVTELEEDVRLATLPILPSSLSVPWLRQSMYILEQIRKEAKDVWSQNHHAKDRGGPTDLYSPEASEDRRAERELLAELLKAPSEKICEIYRARSEARSSTPSGGETRCPRCGYDGTGIKGDSARSEKS